MFVDLGMSPIANSYLRADDIHRMEPFYALRRRVCAQCFLVPPEEFERWADPVFGIEWPHTEWRVMSERDASYPDFRP